MTPKIKWDTATWMLEKNNEPNHLCNQSLQMLATSHPGPHSPPHLINDEDNEEKEREVEDINDVGEDDIKSRGGRRLVLFPPINLDNKLLSKLMYFFFLAETSFPSFFGDKIIE